MGDKSQISIYAPLLAYLQKHGVDLSPSGSAECGLSRAATLDFLELLAERDIEVLGIELWQMIGAEFDCDGLEVWIPAYGEASVEAAEKHVKSLDLQPGDVMTVQFR